jgi:hypothetical protein
LEPTAGFEPASLQAGPDYKSGAFDRSATSALHNRIEAAVSGYLLGNCSRIPRRAQGIVAATELEGPATAAIQATGTWELRRGSSDKEGLGCSDYYFPNGIDVLELDRDFTRNFFGFTHRSQEVAVPYVRQ